MATSQAQKTESTWMQGLLAYRAGVPQDECPYIGWRDWQGEWDCNGWINGWEHGRRTDAEAKRAKQPQSDCQQAW